MANADRRAKDQEMASRMKQMGEERTSGICPMCYKSVYIGPPQQPAPGMSVHVLTCTGPTKRLPVYRGMRRAA